MADTGGIQRHVVAHGNGVRVTEMTLAPGACVPSHRHTHLTDVFYGLEGELVLSADGRELGLGCGQSRSAAPGVVHGVRNTGSGPGRFLLVQSGGEYDFIPEPG